MSMKDDLILRCELIDKLMKLTKERLEKLPEGKLKIKNHNNRIYYYRDEGSNRDKIISRNNVVVAKQLAQRNYLENVLKASISEGSFLKEVIDKYPKIIPEDIYDQLSAERKQLVRPIILPDDQYVREWLEKPYTPKPFHKNDPVFETMKGHRVRSKSEMIIADRLFTNGIPYKYECPLVLGKEIRHPDFTVLKVSERKVLYLEHCGKVGDEGYADDMVDRINLYSENGILLGDRLFLTLESSNRPFDVRTLDNLINEIFR